MNDEPSIGEAMAQNFSLGNENSPASDRGVASRWSGPFASRVLVLLLLFWTIGAHAGRYELDKKDDPEENYQFSDVDGVCAAYEKNLARFAHLPYGMACRRELDPALGFARPRWEKLDMVKHADLVRDILRHLRWEDTVKKDSRPWAEHVKEMTARGTTLEVAYVDADGDGKPDNLLRFGKKLPCDPSHEILQSGPLGRRMMVASANLTKILPIPITVVGDAILYKGKTYADVFFGEPTPIKGRNATLYLYKFTRWGTSSSCRFRYIDPALIAPKSK